VRSSHDIKARAALRHRFSWAFHPTLEQHWPLGSVEDAQRLCSWSIGRQSWRLGR
jgi:hypothetical protein